MGWGEDADDDLRKSIATVLVDDETDEIADVVLLWFREDDGAMRNQLSEARVSLSADGGIWSVTAKAGLHGYLESVAITTAKSASLSHARTTSAGQGWTGTYLVTSMQ
ncbi:DUF3052 family protein [Streptomyces sp. NPDC016562]|uniref:DUF3052 family protein n=1 Tax=Streptomyces sp. NPDC016562 TaxID=3364966 RepID=UPI0036F636BB